MDYGNVTLKVCRDGPWRYSLCYELCDSVSRQIPVKNKICEQNILLWKVKYLCLRSSSFWNTRNWIQVVQPDFQNINLTFFSLFLLLIRQYLLQSTLMPGNS